MQIAYFVGGEQRTTKGQAVKEYTRVEFAGNIGFFNPVRAVRWMRHAGWLDRAEGSVMEDDFAQPFINPDAPGDVYPEPSYLWFPERADALKWLAGHGYRPLDELTVSVPEA